MEISVKEIENNTVIIKLFGDIDIYTSSDLKDAMISQVIMDMEDVHYIDSSGIGVFIAVLGTFKKVNGKIGMIKITEPVKKVLELTRLTSFLPVYNTEAEAIEKL
ncbi:MAG: STAS domain-containing protein [Brachyspira sp.]|nr:STAS domain-containing protein [Brachyspira sp.]